MTFPTSTQAAESDASAAEDELKRSHTAVQKFGLRQSKRSSVGRGHSAGAISDSGSSDDGGSREAVRRPSFRPGLLHSQRNIGSPLASASAASPGVEVADLSSGLNGGDGEARGAEGEAPAAARCLSNSGSSFGGSRNNRERRMNRELFSREYKGVSAYSLLDLDPTASDLGAAPLRSSFKSGA